MSYLTDDLDQVVTYWAPAAVTREGIPGQSAPVELSARWEDVAELFRGPDGREQVSKSKVWVEQDVTIGGWLFHGASASGTPPTGAYEIRGWTKTPEIGGDGFERVAIL